MPLPCGQPQSRLRSVINFHQAQVGKRYGRKLLNYSHAIPSDEFYGCDYAINAFRKGVGGDSPVVGNYMRSRRCIVGNIDLSNGLIKFSVGAHAFKQQLDLKVALVPWVTEDHPPCVVDRQAEVAVYGLAALDRPFLSAFKWA